MTTPAVAITGIGVVSPYGVGRERFWKHIKSGCSATRTVTDFDATPYGCTVAAPVPPVSIDDAVKIDERLQGLERAERPAGSAAVFAGLAHRRHRRDRGVGGRRTCASANLTPACSSAVAPGGSTSPSVSTSSSSPTAGSASRPTPSPSRSSACSRARSRSPSSCTASATWCRPGARARPTRFPTRRRLSAAARRK